MNEQARTNPGMIKELSVLKQRIQELEHSESERKQAEEELRESEERFRTLSDMTPLGMCLIDIDGRYEYVNPAFVKIFGYDLSDIPTGKEWFRTAYPDPEYRREVMADWKEDLSSFPKLQIKPRIYEVRCKEGDFRTILFRTVTLPTGKHLIIYEDITESKRAAESNRRESLFRQSIIDNATEGICVCHDVSEFPYTRFTVWNHHMTNITGYTMEEINFQGWYQSVYPDPEIQAKASARMARMRQGDNLHQDEWEITRKDGQRRQLLISTCIVLGGEIGVNVLAVMNDITERKRAEEALRESKERYRTLVDNATDIVFRTDNNGHFTFVNPAGIRITGYEEKELIGKHYPTLIRPDMRDEAIKLFGRQFVKGIDNTYTEYPILTKAGHDVWLGQNTQLIVEDGHVTGFQAVSRDITERKGAEEALRKSEDRFRLAAQSVTNIIWEWNINQGKLDWYGDIDGLLGYRPDEFPHTIEAWEKIIHPDDHDRVMKALDAHVQQGKPYREEYRIIKKDGLHGVWLDGGIVQKDQTGKTAVMIGAISDITERKQAEEKLRESLEQLRRAMQTTIQVLVMAVEIKDPYTAGHQRRMTSLARTMATEMGLPPEKIEGLRMAGVIHDIGKITLPTEILSKPTKLSGIELSLIREHVRLGYDILKDVESPWPLAEIVLQHHERMDGSGYPRGLKGEEILIEARILAVADVVEAMASHRPYRAALGLDAALEEIEKNRGLLYDSHAVDTCLRVFREKGYQLEGT